MKNPMDRRILRTKESIRREFLSLLRERGYDKITVTELAFRANINRKTFYQYYTGIDDLMDHLETELIENYAPLFRSIDLHSDLFDPYPFAKRFSDQLAQDMPTLQLLAEIDRLPKVSGQAKSILVDTLQPQLIGHGFDADQLRLFLEYAVAGVLAMITDWIKAPTNSLGEFTSFLVRITQGAFRAFSN